MKKLLLLLSITFLLSCSSDDDQAVTKEGNFLDVYNGVVWLEQNNDSNYDLWHIFSPEGIIIGESSFSKCSSDYAPWNVVVDEFKAEVVVNSENTLKLKMYEIDDTLEWVDYTATFIVSNNGNTLTATYSDEPGYSELYSLANEAPCD